MFKLLKDKELLDQMFSESAYSKNGRTRDLSITITAIESACRGGNLSSCRDKKKHQIISESDWDQIVKCHHGHADKITLSGGIVFDLNEYDWHQDSRVNDLKFNFGY